MRLKMIDAQIIEKINALRVADKFNFKRTIQINKKLPEYLRKATNKNEIVILGNGNLLDFYNQPVVVIPVNDFLAMLTTCKMPRPRRWRRQKERLNHETN
jgi:acetyl-CoA carboxylase beta subunit